MKKLIIIIFLFFIIFNIPVSAQDPYGGSYPDFKKSSKYNGIDFPFNMIIECNNSSTSSYWIKSMVPLVVGNYNVAPYDFQTLFTYVAPEREGQIHQDFDCETKYHHRIKHHNQMQQYAIGQLPRPKHMEHHPSVHPHLDNSKWHY